MLLLSQELVKAKLELQRATVCKYSFYMKVGQTSYGLYSAHLQFIGFCPLSN